MRRCFDGLYFSYKKPAAHKETGIDFENQPTSDLAIWQLLEEFHKSIVRKFQKIKVYASFKDNIWSAGLADMQLINKWNQRIRFFLCVIGVFNKYSWVFLLKDKKGSTITNAFQKNLGRSRRN